MDTSSFAAAFGPPPALAVPVDWDAVESWLGLRLPNDYKYLATTYGPVDIGELLWLHTPCFQEERFEYASWLEHTHRYCRMTARKAPPYEPPAFHPSPGGLLAWGTTRTSNFFFWDTGASPDPDRWPVVVFDRDATNRGITPWHTYDLTVLETLTTAVRTGLPLPSGEVLGPLPATARRTAFLDDAQPWTPPAPSAEVVPAALRRAALTEGSGLETLRLLIPPPETPYLGGGTWDQLFGALGTTLPTEYVTLLDTYGAGCWSNWLRFVTPLRTGDRGFLYWATKALDGYRMLRADFPEYHPLPVWPEPGGFLPFASSIDGDDLGWLTEGDPDKWPLIVAPRHADQGPPLPGNLTETLLEWARGRFTADGFAGLDALDDPLEFHNFKPWDNEARW